MASLASSSSTTGGGPNARCRDSDLRTFENTCESFSVNSRLLYNDIEQLSNSRFRYTQQLIRWSRWLTAAAIAAAGVGGVAFYYQRAKIHRVWRLRHPERVRQLSLLMMVSGGFSLCTILFLVSPIGLMRLHDKEVRRTQQLDAIAVSALVQEQNFRTLAEWSREGETTDTTSVKNFGGSEASTMSVAAPVWVWKEVVIDPTQLLTDATSASPTHETEKAETHAKTAAAAAATDSASGVAEEKKKLSDVDAAKRQLASELLLAPAPVEAVNGVDTRNDGSEANTKAIDVMSQRRVWQRTSDEAELQTILSATKEMWDYLVQEKTDLIARVF